MLIFIFLAGFGLWIAKQAQADFSYTVIEHGFVETEYESCTEIKKG
jgi:hypothetical protein